MLSNLHTHTSFCDGKNTPEEMVISAIDRGFVSLGFSGHGYTPHDLISSMKDTEGYIREISRLKEKYKDKIEIYLGVEEDATSPVDRYRYDYIIGSSHFLRSGDTFYPFDVSYDSYLATLAAFDRDPIKMAHAYYAPFCEYINLRKPDIIGHFDLITKFDEKDTSIFINNGEYAKIADFYLKSVVNCGCLFEVNTGAVARGLRSSPYPSERLLHLLKKEGCGIILSSDSHKADTLDFAFNSTRYMLRNLGFEYVYVMINEEFKKDFLN